MSMWIERNPIAGFAGVLGFFALVFVFGFFVSLQGAAPASYPEPLPPSAYDARILAIDIEAIEAAYREHVQRMYAGWMKDEAGQPTRALTGVRQAQRAYIESMNAIKRRQEGLKGR